MTQFGKSGDAVGLKVYGQLNANVIETENILYTPSTIGSSSNSASIPISALLAQASFVIDETDTTLTLGSFSEWAAKFL